MIERYDRTRHNAEEVKNLLAMAIGYPTREFLQQLPDLVYDISGHLLFVASDKGKVTGVIGIDVTAAPHGWILHLAVHSDYRKQGIGRNLIDEVTKALSLISVTLETDDDAVEFYRACGFRILEIRSKWPRVHRYRCIKGQPPQSVIEYYNNKKLPG